VTDNEWVKITTREWRYERSGSQLWGFDAARIVLFERGAWALYINAKFIGIFPTWEEARDVTPMMLTLHGFKNNS